MACLYRQGAAALHVEVLIAPWSVLQLVLCRLAGSSTLVALLATSTAVIALELFQVLRVAALVEGAAWSLATLHGWYRFNMATQGGMTQNATYNIKNPENKTT